MPSLVLVKWPDSLPPVGEIELTGEPQLIGRVISPECQIALHSKLVSSHHARITAEKGRFFIEDVGSKNGTLHNGVRLPTGALIELKPGDKLGICGYQFVFCEGDDIPTGALEMIVEARVSPEERLRELLAVSTNPDRAVGLGPLLTQVADTLFGGELPSLDQVLGTLLAMFEQVDRGFVILLDENGRLVPKAANRRRNKDDARFCRTLALRSIETMQSYITQTVTGPAWPEVCSVMCAPVATAEGAALGAIQLDTQDRAKKFSRDDLNMLTIVANLAGVTIEKARMHEAIVEREKELRESKLAREVQLGLLPQTTPVVAGYEFFSHYSPARMVGGDYYDFISLPDGRVVVVLADVVGKGMPAALLVATLRSEVRSCLLTVPDLSRAVCRLNQQMMNSGGLRDSFVTLVVMVIDPRIHTLSIVNAGHLSPKLYRSPTRTLSDVITIDQSGPPIGVEFTYQYRAVNVPLAQRDTITAFTDGVPEAMNPAGELFGMPEVERQLGPNAIQAPFVPRPTWVGANLINAVRKHTGSHIQTDDIAVVSFGPWEFDTEQDTTVLP
ncbi:MAG: SpoIIE family protein phosphatase [Planctomycetia bacterium]|nr:SpoIIE family protein phosphatase [Planctomycetia bacterium]